MTVATLAWGEARLMRALPEGRIADRLRAEQYRHFRGETWLEEHLQATAPERRKPVEQRV